MITMAVPYFRYICLMEPSGGGLFLSSVKKSGEVKVLLLCSWRSTWGQVELRYVLREIWLLMFGEPLTSARFDFFNWSAHNCWMGPSLTVSRYHHLIHFNELLYSASNNNDKTRPTLLFFIWTANHDLDIFTFPLFSLCSIITQEILFSHTVSLYAWRRAPFDY